MENEKNALFMEHGPVIERTVDSFARRRLEWLRGNLWRWDWDNDGDDVFLATKGDLAIELCKSAEGPWVITVFGCPIGEPNTSVMTVVESSSFVEFVKQQLEFKPRGDWDRRQLFSDDRIQTSAALAACGL